MASHRFRKALAAQVSTANIVTYLHRLAPVGMLGQSNGITDRLHPGPIFGAREIAWHLGKAIGPFVDAAMPFGSRLVMAITQVFKGEFDLLIEERGDGRLERRLVVLGRNDKVAAAVHDLFAD